MTAIVISGCKKTTGFMQAADVFETFKVIGKVQTLSFDVKEGFSASNFLGKIKEYLETDGEIVSAVFIPNVTEGAYRNPNIKVISDGKKWILLDDVLRAYGYVDVMEK